jgi:type VI secretion system secreted protein VgrG
MPTYTQANRPVRIATALGEDVLLFRKMSGVEGLGRPFQYELVLLSENHDLDYKDIIGKNVTVAVDKGDKEPRCFNGFISRFAQTNYERRLAEYRATVVPWIWFLTRSSDCRIFQGLTVPEIIAQVFKDHGFSDVKDRLHGTYKPRDYCVQYHETAFDFVSRLMEQEGIYYFFKHENGKHTLVMCDTAGSHLEFPGYEELHFVLGRDTPNSSESLWSWVEQHEVQSGGFAVKDYDFKKPRRTAEGTTFHDRAHAGAQFERFEYLGELNADCDPDRYSRIRLEQLQAGHITYTGEGDPRGVCSGVRFTLRGHPRQDLQKEYLTVATEFRIESDPFETSEAANNNFVYEAKLTAIPSTEPFRSPQITPKPGIQGPQTAVVVGPSGEEIYTDKYGRVKVQFHWDRYGQGDENSSCWVRVAQVWAGKKWGAIYTPRIGQEVIIEFLEGDPDRPIITGRVYNEMALPPYELPANKTISTNKSSASKGGAGFNELRFEDKKGEEQIFIHGEKNQDIRIKNDTFEWIGHDRHLVVKNDQVEQVDNDRQEKIKRDHVEAVGRDHHVTVSGKEAIKITGCHSLTVEDDVIEAFKKNQSTQITKNLYIKAENIVLEATKNITINVGDSFIAIESGGIKVATNGDIVLEAKGGILQKANADVKIEAAANASMKGSAGLKLESPAPAELSSSAILTIKGSLVKIN